MALHIKKTNPFTGSAAFQPLKMISDRVGIAGTLVMTHVSITSSKWIPF